ncbi:MAG: sulfatase-like hydrolase/transferase [Candidatus Schekmanbacteria bacterium]|nr:sulfatase-like hydrolase/transferase [Candidatus Schekmanbacteria bacterium]
MSRPGGKKRPASAPAPPAARQAPRNWQRRTSALGLTVALVAGAAAVAWIFFRHTAPAPRDGAPAPATASPPGPPPSGSSRPDILLVTIDTLRADVVGAYGGEAVTPNLDRLAANGVKFDFAHAHNVLTLPSHTNILTGRLPFVHGVRDNSGFRLDPGVPTAASLLRDAGYATAAFVGAVPLDRQFGLDRGFDVYDDHYQGVPLSGAPADFALAERRAEAVVEVALSWLRNRSSSAPWFCWVHLFDPHSPYQPPQRFRDMFPDKLYVAEVSYADSALTPLLDLVAGTGRPTLTIVTGDHGESLGDHREATHGIFAYESTLHVPLIVHGAGVSEQGARIATPAGHVDILPTLLEAAGLPPLAEAPGASLFRLPADRPIYFEALSIALNRGWAPIRGILRGSKKAIELPEPELYDLETDPRETMNLAGERPSDYAALIADLRGLAGELALPAQGKEDPELLKKLQALGYVSGSAPRKDTFGVEDDPKRLIHLHEAYQRGVQLYQQGDKDGAMKAYRGILDERPEMLVASMNLAFIEREMGNLTAAIQTLEDAIEAGSASLSAYSFLATYLTEAGRAKDAVALLDGVLGSQQPDAQALNALGLALGTLGQAEAAVTRFRQVLALDPDDATAYQNIGTVFLQQGDLTGAREHLRRAIQLDATLARAYVGLGVVEASSNNPGGAVDHWKRAVALDNSQYDAIFNLAIMLDRQDRKDEAAQYWKLFLDKAPPDLYGADLERARQRLGS